VKTKCQAFFTAGPSIFYKEYPHFPSSRRTGNQTVKLKTHAAPSLLPLLSAMAPAGIVTVKE